MKKIYRFTKSGNVYRGKEMNRVKLLIQLSKKDPDKYRYILKIDDSIFNGWTIKKFSEENDPNINEKNIFLMEEFFQSLVIKLYREQSHLNQIENYCKERGHKFDPIQWTWDHIREDWLGTW